MSRNSPVRIVRVDLDGRPRWGLVEGDTVYGLQGEVFGRYGRGEELGTLDTLRLLPPTTPTKIVCVGLNYRAHAEESQMALPAEPLLFFKPPSSLIGAGDYIILPPQSQRVDYEAELAVIIGRRCRNVTPQEAWHYVWGVTCGNDITARDLQRRDNQWTRAKGFDTFCPLGPWMIYAPDEADVADLEVICRVNGQVRQRGRTTDMVFSPAQLIAYIASIMTLEPGDVIMTGTPAGIGPLSPGDLVEVEVEGIGVLCNPVKAADR